MTLIQRLSGFAALLLAGGALCAAQTTLPQDSPFAPVGGAAAASAGPAESFVLSGATDTSQGIRVCIYDAQTKHSQWIGMGESFHGVQALNFDPENDRATVRINGMEKVLQLRQGGSIASSGNGLPPFTLVGENPAAGTVTVLRPGGAPGAPPQTDTKTIEQLHQEREARMMVSDILEIGMRQRKAYEDAKRKAAGLPPSGN